MNLSTIKQLAQLRRKLLLALAVMFCISLALQFFINLYSEPELEKFRSEWLTLHEREGRGATQQSREILYNNGLADLAKFHERLYLKNHFARFVGELYDIAAKNNLELVSITYKPMKNKDEPILEYQLDLTVKGRYPQLKKMINDLGSDTNLLVIDSISLASTGPSTDIVQLQIKVTSYFRLEGQ